MKNKFEPLKGKIIDAGELTEEERKDIRGFFVFVKDLESAVQGLLHDLDVFSEILLHHYFVPKHRIDELKELIKKWFADVIDTKEFREDFIKEVQEAEKRVKEGKAKEYTIDEFKRKFKPIEGD